MARIRGWLKRDTESDQLSFTNLNLSLKKNKIDITVENNIKTKIAYTLKSTTNLPSICVLFETIYFIMIFLILMQSGIWRVFIEFSKLSQPSFRQHFCYLT